jgi:hypothetical protein
MERFPRNTVESSAAQLLSVLQETLEEECCFRCPVKRDVRGASAEDVKAGDSFDVRSPLLLRIQNFRGFEGMTREQKWESIRLTIEQTLGDLRTYLAHHRIHVCENVLRGCAEVLGLGRLLDVRRHEELRRSLAHDAVRIVQTRAIAVACITYEDWMNVFDARDWRGLDLEARDALRRW